MQPSACLIDVVIPTVPGREELLESCIASYELSTAPGVLNFIVERGHDCCGKAWQAGMEKSTAPYVHLSADDIEMVSHTWAAVCMESADKGRLPCPLVLNPDMSVQSCGGNMRAKGHVVKERQRNRAVCDFTTLPFLTRNQAEQIGMIDAHTMTDVWVSYRGRQLGWPTVVLHEYEVIHHYSDIGRISSRKQRARSERIFKEAMASVG